MAYTVLADERSEAFELTLTLTFIWALPNGVMGWLDDHRPMRSRVKLAIQLVAALAAARQGLLLSALELPGFGAVDLGPFAWPVTVLWLVWMANAFNFMDGLDGLAAGCGVLFFAGFVALAAGSVLPLAAVAACIAGALLGFLRFNWPPAQIFMGDGGSLFAGATLGGLAVAMAGTGNGASAPFLASVLLLGTFVWDTTYTICWRALTGQPMRPHRTHLFQRLVLAGWSQNRVLGLFWVLTGLCLSLAVAYSALSPTAQVFVLVAALALGVSLVAITRASERSR
jgi:UDP-N-acetylmuramyl pentapeptide phosphotransferase/UDP-N-acetylglucosamine-1-phosphate transferase